MPHASPARSLADLAGLRLATSHPSSTRHVVRGAGHRGRHRDHQRRRGGGAQHGPRGRHRGPRLERLDAHHERPALAGPALRQPGHPRGSAGAPGCRPPAALAAELRTMLEAVIAGRGVKYLMMNAPPSAAAGHRGHPARARVAQRPAPRPRGHGRRPRGRRAPTTSTASWCRCARPAPPASSSCPWRSCCHERRPPAEPAPRPPGRPVREPSVAP